MKKFIEDVVKMDAIKKPFVQEQQCFHMDIGGMEVRMFKKHKALKEELEGKINHIYYAYTMEDLEKSNKQLLDKWYFVVFEKNNQVVRLNIHTISSFETVTWKVYTNIFKKNFEKLSLTEEKKIQLVGALEKEKNVFLEAVKALPENRLRLLTNQQH